MTTTHHATKVLEVGRTAHLTIDGATPICGSRGKLVPRTVADATTWATCSKCRKAQSLPFTVGSGNGTRPEFNSRRRFQ
jgi:hypothetical protein